MWKNIRPRIPIPRTLNHVSKKQYATSSTCVELPRDVKELPIPSDSTVFSMIQPTGEFHLGNYLGALQTWKQLNDYKKADTRAVFGVADLHALTIPKRNNVETFRNLRINSIAGLLSIGIDPNNCIVNWQSSVGGLHCELFWILSCLMPMGYLNRMTQWKAKSKSDELNSCELGLFSYPVLQAADILLYKATHVPVGEDQRQHLEMCRFIAEKFNSFYNCNALPLPKTLLTPTRKIFSLTDPTKKMSKSSGDIMSLIYINDEPSVIREKIMKAKTDSLFNEKFKFDPNRRQGVSNLINIVSGLQSRTIEDVENDIAQFTSFKELKVYVADIVIDSLTEPKKLYNQYLKETEYLLEIITKGSERAREISEANLKEIKKIVGL
ncbi:hypothetical protein KAFR_0H00540 [Kazachstania africana CBS 2517]|uniref:tryptophan--tRNA ligase n=1 Tax=Kazachstania africana (strain ATCC 22294 / BCRC 22015 / CBS 2517 / CECT 1963 / NBRC 1671 / NRRL Y-8276) TaxID=1071382 RepID=H2AYQ7_KAZAF|nr:hypothetical protein KAFR_0H00540 [Kazachstania africana CBS 2517]CCF59463.1 hypothetical protein KAFR_0H00540 [Kazachstania africana CBS 2517]